MVPNSGRLREDLWLELILRAAAVKQATRQPG
jgi:hypothetical protein